MKLQNLAHLHLSLGQHRIRDYGLHHGDDQHLRGHGRDHGLRLVYLEFLQDLMVLLDLKVASSVQSFAPKQINYYKG